MAKVFFRNSEPGGPARGRQWFPLILGLVFVSLLVLASTEKCNAAGNEDRGDVLAVVGDKKITVKAFRAEMERRSRNMPGSFQKPEQREALLTEMINNEVLHRAALESGYDRKPEIMDLLRQMIISGYREEMLEPEFRKISVQEEEMRAYYETHRSGFAIPEMARAAVIKIDVPPKASDEKKAELLKRSEEARAEALKMGPAVASFGGVAVKYSSDQISRYRGGDTGLLRKGEQTDRWPSEVFDTIFSLREPGSISPVIKTSDGYYIVKLMEIKEGSVRPFEEVREMVRSRIFFDKRSAVEKEFYDKLSKKMKVNMDPDLLKTIPPPAVIKIEPPPLPASTGRR